MEKEEIEGNRIKWGKVWKRCWEPTVKGNESTEVEQSGRNRKEENSAGGKGERTGNE